MIMVNFLSQLNNWTTVKESVKIYDVDRTELTLIDLQSWKIYSKFRFVYVVFKSDENVHGGSDQGIFVNYSAIKTGNLLRVVIAYEMLCVCVCVGGGGE